MKLKSLKHPARLLPTLALATVFAISAFEASAALTVTVSAVPGEPNFSSSTGAALPDGSYFQLGTFATAPTTLEVSQNAPGVYAQWQEFADGDADRTFTIDIPGGHAAGDVYGDDAFAGKAIYWWIFLTSDGLAPAANFSNVTEHALFTSSSVDWFFPESSESVSPVVSTADASITFLAGSLDSGNTTINLAAVPEPSSFALSLLALAGCLRRRR